MGAAGGGGGSVVCVVAWWRGGEGGVWEGQGGWVGVGMRLEGGGRAVGRVGQSGCDGGQERKRQ